MWIKRTAHPLVELWFALSAGNVSYDASGRDKVQPHELQSIWYLAH